MRNAGLTGQRTRCKPRTVQWLSAFLLPLSIGLIGLPTESTNAAGKHPAVRVAPAVSIIIDDLGYRLRQDLRAIRLDGAVTCAFLPRSPYARRLAKLAHVQGKEVMLHLPMQAIGPRELDDGGLQMAMSRRQFDRIVREGLEAVPYVRGVNNHMGSLLTQYPERMRWLMEDLKLHRGQLYFVDSFTTFHSVAHAVAVENDLPTIRRDIFLDTHRDPDFIRRQFELLLERAAEHGTAVAIGHPYPETLDFLEANLDRLAEHGIELLPVSALIERKRALEDPHGGIVLAAGPRGPDNNPAEDDGGKLAN